MRRALFVLLGVAVVVAAAAVVIQPSRSHDATDVEQLELPQLVGARIVTGYLKIGPPPDLLAAIREGRVAGVVTYGENFDDLDDVRRANRAFEAAAAEGGLPPPLLMIDQEGASVKRFRELPPDLAAVQIGRRKDVSGVAKRQGRLTGAALADLGFNVNLAPVADVDHAALPYMEDRSFGVDPTVVAKGACGFADGLEQAGVVGVFKHFPGLGWAQGDTDHTIQSVDAPKRALTADLEPYRSCAARRTLVMMSNAAYPSLGIDDPALMDPRAYELLGSTGFEGWTISEAFSTPSIEQARNAAIRSVNAGLDVVLFGPPDLTLSPYDEQLLAGAQKGLIARSDLEAGARRVFELREKLAAAKRR